MTTENQKPSDAPSGAKDMTATAEALREFLRKMEAKKPEDILGAAAHGSLGKSLVQATLGTAVLLAALTFGPYVLAHLSNDPAKPADPAAKAPAAKDDAKDVKDAKDQKAAVARPVAKDDRPAGKGGTDTVAATKDTGAPPSGVDKKAVEKVLGAEVKKGGAPDIDSLVDGLGKK